MTTAPTSPHSTLRGIVAGVTLSLALCAASACSDGGGARTQPADLSLSTSDHECVDLTKGAAVETTLCATNITSFDVELTYDNPKAHYGLLAVVDGQMLPSPDYVIWDEKGKFVLVASAHRSVSLRELTYLVLSKGQTLRCSGAEQILQCRPEAS